MILQKVSSFLENSRDGILLDIRPNEYYLRGHLPTAISLPFPVRLKELRHQYSSPISNSKLKLFIENIDQWKKQVLPYFDDGALLYVYCQTCGLRSGYFHQALEEYSASMLFLEGGYDGYCHFQTSYFEELQLSNLYVLKGKTGSGKTEMLRVLADQGKQVIDLVFLAKHNGSVFGNLTRIDQPTSVQFQHDLLEVCLGLNQNKPVFVESEGAFIGSVAIPKSFIDHVEQGKVIQLCIPKSGRVEYLLAQYSHATIPNLLDALKKLQNRLAPSDYNISVKLILNDRKKDFISLIVDYYDQSSGYQTNKNNIFQTLNLPKADPFEAVQLISKYCK